MFYPKDEWLRRSPEEMGMDSSAIERALDAIVKSGKDIHSMLIVRDGALLFEHYFAPYTQGDLHAMYSCSKTFTSMLIGIAEAKGLLSTMDKVSSFYPEYAPSPDMTIRDLLIMGSGHGEDTFPAMLKNMSEDWAKIFFECPVTHAPGTHFVYNTGATYMLSSILQRVTKKTAKALLKEWILGDIGVSEYDWDTDPQGISLGGTGLYIQPRTMARFGHLLLNEGRWAGRQIIPAEYVRAAREKQIDNKNPNDPAQNPNWASGYGYQMWRCAFDAFRADGMGGQYIVMSQRHGMVFVFTSGLGADIGYPLDIVRDYLLPGVSFEPLPGRDAVRLPSDVPGKVPEGAKAFPFGRRILLRDNGSRIRLEALTVLSDEIILETGKEICKIPFRFRSDNAAVPACVSSVPEDLPECFGTPFPMRATRVNACATWGEAGLMVMLAFVSEPLTLRLHFTPDGARMRIDVLSTMAGDCMLMGDL